MLRIEDDGPVRRLTLDRPEVLNAFNDQLILALTEGVLGISPMTRAIVLRGEGKAFSAGGDLEWMRKAAAYTEEQNFEDAMRLAGLFRSIAESPAVVVAGVHGVAFGGGCGLVASADVAIAHPDTKFAFSEVRLGLIPATISPFVIPKIGAGHARALFSTGEAFDAPRALRIGLVHEVQEDLDPAIDAKLDAILSAGPRACAQAKRIALAGFATLDDAARALARARAGEEGREGVAAFLEKRRPSFAVRREAKG